MKKLIFSLIVLVAIGLWSFNIGYKMEGFQIEKGFQLDLIAEEPLVLDPVDIEFNERGDALVLEMPGYPFEDANSHLKVLFDTNHDGKMDASQVIHSNLGLASSFLPVDKGILVASPPYLLFLQDVNADYAIEKVDTLMGGFAKDNLQHNFNGLSYGMDGWIYAANGGNDGSPFWWGKPDTKIVLKGQDFRFHLTEKRLEKIGESSGGFGLAQDEYNRLYETHNLTHVSHLVFPQRYIKDNALLVDNTLDNISDHEENGLARIYPIGEQEDRVNHSEQAGYFSGSCGISYYGGGAFGKEYEQTVWVADVVLNLIHVDKLSQDGSSMKAHRLLPKRDFLASSDRSFRPVNMSVAPDGSMWVADMYRKVIEHPEWIPDEIEKTLDLNAGKNQGRIYRISKQGAHHPFDYSQFKSTSTTIQALKSPNQWVRLTALRLLRGGDLSNVELQALGNHLKSDQLNALLPAAWLLFERDRLSSDQLSRLLHHPNSGIRENAIKLAELGVLKERYPVDLVLEALLDKDPRVRMQAALSSSLIPSNIRTKQKNRILDYLTKYALLPQNAWTIAALNIGANDLSMDLFARLVKDKYVSSGVLLSLSSNIKQNPSSLLAILSKSSLSGDLKAKIIERLGIANLAIKSDRMIDALTELEKSDNLTLISEVNKIKTHLNLPVSDKWNKILLQSPELVLNRKLPESKRLGYLKILETVDYSIKSKTLFHCLSNVEPLQIQQQAIEQLSKLKNKEIGWEILKLWPELSPQTRKLAGDLLLNVESNHDALLSGLEKKIINIGEMNFDLERRRTLLWWTSNADTRKRAAKLFSDAGVQTRKDAIESMKPALELVGTPEAGKKVFMNICSNCHQFKNWGVAVGPVLTEISRKSKATLLHEILDPNSNVDTKYINHRVELNDGKLFTGIISSETDTRLVITMVGGSKQTILKNQIKKLNSLGTSLMMEGLESAMSKQEMADLLAFIRTQ